MMELSFARAWILSLLWIVPALWAWWAVVDRRRGKALAAFVCPQLQSKILPPRGVARGRWQIGLLCSGVALMLLAAARPRWGEREELVYTRGRDLLIALDVSRSMLADDVRPNRLRRAKADIMDLVGELEGDRAGLLAFRHKAVMLCPLTTDYAFLRQAIDAVALDSAPRGPTDIGDAITKAMDAFDNEDGSHKAIVLISDGEDLSGRALAAADRAAEARIPIFTVGIGDERGSRIPSPEGVRRYVQYQDEDVVTRLNNETLDEIARRTGGAYVPIGTLGMAGTTLGTIYRSHLRRVAEQDLEETLQRRYVERYQLFLLPGVLLAVAACFLSTGRLQTGPPPAKPGQAASNGRAAAPLKNLSPAPQPLRPAVVALAVLWWAGAAASARAADTPPTNGMSGTRPMSGTVETNAASALEVPAGRSGARYAQRRYRTGDYTGAAEAYLQAARGATRDARETFQYNAAAACFRAGEYAKAARILGDLDVLSARPDPTVTRALGAALARAGMAADPDDAEGLAEKVERLTEAAEAYAEAARAGASGEVTKDLGTLTKQLPELREEARIAELREAYADRQPFDIADSMLESQRDIRERVGDVRDRPVPERIRAMEKLAREQSENADLWIPLKGKLLAALSQQAAKDEEVAKQMQQFVQGMELTRDSMRGTAKMLRDARFDGVDAVQTDENAVYGFWKMLAPSEPLVGEALRRQTHAIGVTESTMPDDGAQREAAIREAASDQAEVRALTDLFLERFQTEHPEQSPATPAPADSAATNAAPRLSPEDRARIRELAADAQQKEQEAYELLSRGDLGKSLVVQEDAHKLLSEVAALLPKPPPQQGEQQQEQQEEEGDQNDQQGDRQNQEQGSQSDSQGGQSDDSSQQQEEQSASSDQQKDGAGETEQSQSPDMTQTNDVPPEEVLTLLQKALEREREHEAAKRERNRRFPMAPHEKDW